jgi:proteasome-associated ATPase
MDLETARRTVRELRQSIADAAEKPAGFGAVIGETGDGRLYVHVGNTIIIPTRPRHIKVPVPSLVTLNASNQVLGVVPSLPEFGAVGVVSTVDEEARFCQVALGPGAVRFVRYPEGSPPSVDDRVLLDLAMVMVTKNLGKPMSELTVRAETGVAWADVVGQEEAKRQLREAVIEPTQHADLYRSFGKAPTKGVLLWGRPGNGKTYLAKALVTAMAELHGDSARTTGLISVKGPELLNKFVGASEEGVRGLFVAAREHHRRHGYPAVVLIDEADALLGRRGRQGIEGMERTIVPQFLADMDGVDPTSMRAVVVLCTNRPDSLDPAVVRDGRVDRRIEVTAPTALDAEAIVAKVLTRRRCAAPAEELAARARERLFEDRRPLFMLRMRDRAKDRRVTAADFVSGAACAGIAERAVQLALRRAVDGGDAEGVGFADVERAVDDHRESLRGLDHEAALFDLAASYAEGEVLRAEVCR